MIIQPFKTFNGQHCETTATGSLLLQLGIELSEPLLFGIGEGLGYIFWNMKTMDYPFIGGRVKPDVLTENICRNLNLKLEVKETSSTKKAWENVKHHIDNGKAVGLKLDCYHLDYFTTKIHFAGHYASIYGYDEELAYLNDTNQQGRDTRTTLRSLALARNEKGPMSSRNRSFTIAQTEKLPDLKSVVIRAINNNARDFLNSPIRNLGYKGIAKTATEIKKWFKGSKAVESEFQTAAMLMERAGTGGALFRNLYRDFLQASYEITGLDALHKGYEAYREHAKKWTDISGLFQKIGETKHENDVKKASEIFLQLSNDEKQTMEALLQATSDARRNSTSSAPGNQFD